MAVAEHLAPVLARVGRFEQPAVAGMRVLDAVYRAAGMRPD